MYLLFSWFKVFKMLTIDVATGLYIQYLQNFIGAFPEYDFSKLFLNNYILFLFQILQHSTNWGMDMFAVGELTNERPLTSICFTIFKVSRLARGKSPPPF